MLKSLFASIGLYSALLTGFVSSAPGLARAGDTAEVSAPSLIERRLKAAIQHQNQLRAAHGAPLLGGPIRQTANGQFDIDTPGEAVDDPTVGIFFTVGEALLRSH